MDRTVYMNYGGILVNLVILLNSNNIDVNKISYSLVDKYILILIKKLKENDLEFNIQIGEKEIEDFFNEYKEYFKRNEETKTIDVIKIPPVDCLFKLFEVGLPNDAFYALEDDSILIELLQAYRDEIKEEYDKKILMVNNKILKLVMNSKN